MADAQPSPAPEPELAPESEGGEGDAAEEGGAEVGTFAAKITGLKEIKIDNGEDNEDILFKMRAKLFLFKKADEKYGGQMEWKEKGTG